MKYIYLTACVFTLRMACVAVYAATSPYCANPDDYDPTVEIAYCDGGEGDSRYDCEQTKPRGQWTQMSCGEVSQYLDFMLAESVGKVLCDPQDTITEVISSFGTIGCCGIGQTVCGAQTNFDGLDVCKNRDTADLEKTFGECEGGRENVPRSTRRECDIARGTWVTRTCAEGFHRIKAYLDVIGVDPTSEDFCSSPAGMIMGHIDQYQCCGALGATKCSLSIQPADVCENKLDFKGAKVLQSCSDDRAKDKKDCKRRRGDWEVTTCKSLAMDMLNYASSMGVDVEDETKAMCSATIEGQTIPFGSLLTHSVASQCCEGGRTMCSDALNEPHLSDVCAVPSDFDADAVVNVNGERQQSCADAARAFTSWTQFLGIDVNDCSATIDINDDDTITNLAALYAFMVPPQCCGVTGQRKCGTPYPGNFAEIICENPEEFRRDRTVGFCDEGPSETNFYKKKSECREDWKVMTCEDRARYAFDQATYVADVPFDQLTCGAVVDTPWGKQIGDNVISKFLAPKCCKPACSSKMPRSCRDDKRWRGRKPGATCKWVAEDPQNRCRMRGNRGRAFEGCPRACNTCRDD